MANAPCKPTKNAAQYKWSMKWHYFGDIYCTCNQRMRSHLLTELCKASKAELTEALTTDSNDVSPNGTSLLARIARLLRKHGNLKTKWGANWPSQLTLGVRRLPDVFSASGTVEGVQLKISKADLAFEMIITPKAIYVIWPFKDDACDDGRTLEQKVAEYGIDIPVLKANEYVPERDLLASQAFYKIDNAILSDVYGSPANKAKLRQKQRDFKKCTGPAAQCRQKRKKAMRKVIRNYQPSIKLPDIDFEGKLDEAIECTILAATKQNKLVLMMGLKAKPSTPAPFVEELKDTPLDHTRFVEDWPCGNVG